jgi:hypothetical protein
MNWMIANRRNIFYGCLIIWAVGTAYAAGGEISVSSSIDKSEIAYEDEVQLTVELKWEGDITAYRFEIIPLPETEKLQAGGSSTQTSSLVEDSIEYTVRTYKYDFRPILAGTGIIRPITFNYVTWPDSLPGQLTTQEYRILIAEPKLVVTKGGISTAGIIVIIVVIIVIAAAVVFVIIRKKTRFMDASIPPEETFIQDLERIKKDHHADRKLFFGALHKALLNYLGNRFGMETAGKTMSTIKAEVSDLDTAVNHQEKIIQLLEMAESEKFAPRQGEPGDILRLCTELENHFSNINNRNISEA